MLCTVLKSNEYFFMMYRNGVKKTSQMYLIFFIANTFIGTATFFHGVKEVGINVHAGLTVEDILGKFLKRKKTKYFKKAKIYLISEP